MIHLIDFLLWLAVFQALSPISYLLLQFRLKPLVAWSLAKPVGLLLIAGVPWYCSYLFDVATPVVRLYFLSIVAFGLGFSWLSPWARQKYQALPWKEVVYCELLFLGFFLTFLSLRAMNPEIHWGEKPMDFAFLNFFSRSGRLPAEDPWAAGSIMRYYYFGFYLYALLVKVTGIPTAVAYNLAVATIPALSASALFGILIQLVKRPAAAAGATTIVLLSGTPELLRLLLLEGLAYDSHAWWASTRLFTPPGFTEYPLWSYLFGDLHPHVMSQPFLLAGVAIAIANGMRRRQSFYLLALTSYLLGCIFVTNAWDYIALAGLLLGLMLISPRRLLLPRCLGLLIVGFGSIVFLLPWLLTAPAGEEMNYGVIQNAEFNRVHHYLAHYGVWIALLFLSVRYAGRPLARSLMIGAVPLVWLVVLWVFGLDNAPWGLFVLCSVLVTLLAQQFQKQGVLPQQQILLFLAGFGLVQMLAVESLFLIDRMNALFKFNLTIWFLLAIPAVGLPISASTWIWRVVVGSGILSGLLGVGIFLCTPVHWWRPGPRPTLDGTAFLQALSPHQFKLITWMNASIQGVETIVEAHGPSYAEYSRISTYTGLPTVVGWDYHIVQRGLSEEELERRKDDVSEIYQTQDAEIAVRLMDRYRARWLVFGALERTRYGVAGLAKFSDRSQFALRFESGDERVYERLTQRLCIESESMDAGDL